MRNENTHNSMSMEEKKVNVGYFVKFCLFVMMMCSAIQCVGIMSLDTRLNDINKDIHALIIKDNVAVDSTVVYKVKK